MMMSCSINPTAGELMRKLLAFLALIPFMAQAHDLPRAQAAPTEGASNYVVRLEQMQKIAAGKGETIHLLRGNAHGFKNLSFIISETAPGGGPPLHTHESEEAHILTAGTMSYVVGDSRFVVSAPYILRVPANVPHTFINAGTSPLSLTAVFDNANYTFRPIAANPLQAPPEK
jgi:mannose-6-phosphate isomerase-like protein (cupin superfamily)